MGFTIRTGRPYPLGAHADGRGVNFSLFSENATKVELCLFDEKGTETGRLVLPEKIAHVWHGYVPGLKDGQRYGYRVYGPYDPDAGHRFNPSKLLMDPYARAMSGDLTWSDAMLGYAIGGPEQHMAVDDRDSASGMPKCMVIDADFDWHGDQLLRKPLADSVILELHVKGFTKLCKAVPEHLRGTYAGLAHPVVIDYLQRLGVTAVELLPVHQFITDRWLEDRGTTNYWGYNTLGFFAPHGAYSAAGDAGGQVKEFKTMVRALHAAGIEVILDVVYNHTCEGNQLGPTLAFRGIDNASYYRLVPAQRRYYTDYTGCGNSLNLMNSYVLQMVVDSLRYWVAEMHVDGFRFDLCSTLGRLDHAFSKTSPFFSVLHQDPVLSQVKLIAEPWDIGEGGYQVGGHPVIWSEWNGQFRDTSRRYWKGDEGQISDIAAKMIGSPQTYRSNGRRPTASVNFVTSHDGFTMADLVAYNQKHNIANGENNQDGDNHNNSWNCGVEGETDDATILTLRRRQRRNLMTTLLLAQGVPMLAAGDEFGRTQNGNNNAYCQDNVLSWLSWERTVEGEAFYDFVRELIAFRKKHPVFRRPRYLRGQFFNGSAWKDVTWYNTAGVEMRKEDWTNHFGRCLGMMLCGASTEEADSHGRLLVDETYLLLFNSHAEPLAFTLPGPEAGQWKRVLDTAEETGFLAETDLHPVGEIFPIMERSFTLFVLAE